MNKAELEQFSEHIAYELSMMGWATEQCRELRGKRSNEANAALECFLLHYRNLHYFFWKNGVKDDVTAKHYGYAADDAPKECDANVENAHKKLAHITRQRVNKTGYNVIAIAIELLSEAKRFVEKVDSAYLFDKFPSTTELQHKIDVYSRFTRADKKSTRNNGTTSTTCSTIATMYHGLDS